MTRLLLILASLLAILHCTLGQFEYEDEYLFSRRVGLGPIDLDESAVPTPEDPDGDGIIGAAGKHYPILKKVPETSFLCNGRIPGMYADVETRCQVYHVCQADLRKESSLCANGTIFNQETFSCDWWYNVDCSIAPSFYELNANIGKPSQGFQLQDVHPQILRRKLPLLEKGPPPPPPPTFQLDIPGPDSILKQIHPPPSLPQFAPPPPPPPPPPPQQQIRRKKLRRPVTSRVPQVHEHSAPPPPPSIPRPILKSSHSKPQEGQYLRDVFDPALHLPRPKPLSAKKLAAKQQHSLGLSKQPDKSPMMLPVKSRDTLSGYSEFYLNKPVDED